MITVVFKFFFGGGVGEGAFFHHGMRIFLQICGDNSNEYYSILNKVKKLFRVTHKGGEWMSEAPKQNFLKMK